MGADILGLDLEAFDDWLIAVATVLGAAAALIAVWRTLGAWYRRTLGRRRDRYDRLARLGTQAQLSFFESVIGEPPAMRRTIEADVHVWDAGVESLALRTFLQCFFIDRDYYVQTVSDEDGAVIAFSVTTRSRRFAPPFSFPAKPGFRRRREWRKLTGRRFHPFFKIKLGHSRFSDLDTSQWRPQRKAEMGARTYSYTELFYLGNPGNYQHFGFTASVAAIQAPVGNIGAVVNLLGREWAGGVGDENTPSEEFPEIQNFRRETTITTYTVLGPQLSPEDYPTTFGPHGDEVRTLP